MSRILLIADLDLPPSINELYATTREGRRILSSKGREYKDYIQNILWYNTNVDGRYLYQDTAAVQHIRAANELTKKWTSRKKEDYLSKFSVTCLYVYTDNRSDVDNRFKCLQDNIAEWLEVDDKRVFEAINRKTIDRDAAYSHVEVLVREIETVHWTSGSLILQGRSEVETDMRNEALTKSPGFYGQPTVEDVYSV